MCLILGVPVPVFWVSKKSFENFFQNILLKITNKLRPFNFKFLKNVYDEHKFPISQRSIKNTLCDIFLLVIIAIFKLNSVHFDD